MRAANVGSVFVVSSFRMSNFGMKPVNGGSPPNDARVSIVVDTMAGDSGQVVPMSVMVFVVVMISVVKMVVVIRI